MAWDCQRIKPEMNGENSRRYSTFQREVKFAPPTPSGQGGAVNQRHVPADETERLHAVWHRKERTVYLWAVRHQADWEFRKDSCLSAVDTGGLQMNNSAWSWWCYAVFVTFHLEKLRKVRDNNLTSALRYLRRTCGTVQWPVWAVVFPKILYAKTARYVN